MNACPVILFAEGLAQRGLLPCRGDRSRSLGHQALVATAGPGAWTGSQHSLWVGGLAVSLMP